MAQEARLGWVRATPWGVRRRCNSIRSLGYGRASCCSSAVPFLWARDFALAAALAAMCFVGVAIGLDAYFANRRALRLMTFDVGATPRSRDPNATCAATRVRTSCCRTATTCDPIELVGENDRRMRVVPAHASVEIECEYRCEVRLGPQTYALDRRVRLAIDGGWLVPGDSPPPRR
ncbi:MAG: hypothetical protein IAG13_10260 [Deltaproteobacteria bacterium]|nr:hypothetical protein [Nannocystaceae bacterium]